jgi:hypothetical protein
MAVIPIIALATAAVAFFLFLSYQVWLQSGREGAVDDLSPVDLEAFRNLTDPEEMRYLRINLSPREFRRIQRTRLRAAAMYISVISKNATLLMVIGRTARTHSDAEIVSAGLDVTNRAILLKVWCSLSLLKLNATMICPTLMSPSSRIAERYIDVTSLTATLPTKLAA